MVTVNGRALAEYLGQEERTNPDLQDKKSREIQKFLTFEIKMMSRLGRRHIISTQPVRTMSQAAKG